MNASCRRLALTTKRYTIVHPERGSTRAVDLLHAEQLL
jgi:hypothetical protein